MIVEVLGYRPHLRHVCRELVKEMVNDVRGEDPHAHLVRHLLRLRRHLPTVGWCSVESGDCWMVFSLER